MFLYEDLLLSKKVADGRVTVKAMTQINVDTNKTQDMYELLKKEKLITQ